MTSRLLDSLLDLSVAPGYTKVGYRLRGLSWSSATAGRLTGGVALVTGASSGLGEAACEGLARAGARVHMLVRDLERGRAARERIKSRLESDSHLELHSCDLADLAAVRQFARRFTAERAPTGRPRSQRGAIAGRATADRGRVRGGVRDQRARSVRAHQPARRAPPPWTPPPRDQRLVGRHVHRAAGRGRPAAGPNANSTGRRSTRTRSAPRSPSPRFGPNCSRISGSVAIRCIPAGPTRRALPGRSLASTG